MLFIIKILINFKYIMIDLLFCFILIYFTIENTNGNNILIPNKYQDSGLCVLVYLFGK
jgi:hypothetical protein